MILAWISGTIGVLAALFGLHRLMLYLERYDWRSSWRQTGGSGGYCPLLEICQPQIRHVVEVQEQRQGDVEDGSGAPKQDRAGSVLGAHQCIVLYA
jgi:hypothetical protein